jgi:hypothetical protein
MTRIDCSCCAKQIIQGQSTDTEYTAPGIGARSLGLGKYCCGTCSMDLNRYGFFPEEWALLDEWDRHQIAMAWSEQ